MTKLCKRLQTQTWPHCAYVADVCLTCLNLTLFQVSIILLSLQMIEGKVNIDIFSLLKIKFHLAQVVGFSDVSIVPASSGHAFHVRLGKFGNVSEQGIPCVNQLPIILDAGHPFELAPSAVGGPYVEDDTQYSLLVGTIFVDVSLTILSLTTNLLSLPVLTIKSMLESLMIIIYKHDLDAKPLKHLHGSLMRAVRRAMELVSQDISYEIRELALSVIQAYVKRWPTIRNVFVLYVRCLLTSPSLKPSTGMPSRMPLSSSSRCVIMGKTYLLLKQDHS
jgi:hypothetical protein